MHCMLAVVSCRMKEIILVTLTPDTSGLACVGPFWTPIFKDTTGNRPQIQTTPIACHDEKLAMELGMVLWGHLLEDAA